MKKKRWTRDDTELTLLGLPAAIWFLLFCYLPMFGLIIAFKDYRIQPGKSFLYSLLHSDWVGFSNFNFFLSSKQFPMLLRNTIVYNLVFIVLGIVLPVGLAMMISQIYSRRKSKVYQTMMFFPHFMSWVVISYFVYAFLSPDKGLINSIIEALGGERIMWYSNSTYWPFILVFMQVWKTLGYSMVVYLASITGIDHTLYEAAMLDGATKWQQAKYITLPCLKPIIIIMFTCVGQPQYAVMQKPDDSEQETSQTVSDPTDTTRLLPGDVIVSVEGKSMFLLTDYVDALRGKKAGDTAEIEVVRNDRPMTLEVVLAKDANFKNMSDVYVVLDALGIYGLMGTPVKQSFFGAVGDSFVYSGKLGGLVLRSLGELLTGKMGLDSMGGPVTTIKATSEAALSGIWSFLNISGFIGVNLAVFNLLPIPALDGSKVIGFFLPMNLYARFENFFARYQQIILYAMIVLLFVLPRLGGPLSVLSNIIDVPFNWLWNAMFWAANKLTFFVDLIAGAVL